MKIVADVSSLFYNAEKWLKKHGDALWDALCDELPVDAHFKPSEVAKVASELFRVKPSTAENYAAAFLRNVVAMPEGGLFLVRPRVYRFHDKNGL